MRQLASASFLGGALSLAAAFNAMLWICTPEALADVISPSIGSENGGEDENYSNEPSNVAFFGKGVSGRMSEASYKRFAGEQGLLEGKFEEAYKNLSKAVQLDPGDPTGHVMLARAMTGMLRKQKIADLDRDLLAKTIKEWKLIARHDADLTEQLEAGANLRKLGKVVKVLKERDAKINEESDKAMVAGKPASSTR
jgi:hypothetical protein